VAWTPKSEPDDDDYELECLGQESNASDEGFRELVQTWRKDHPAPVPQRKTPAGLLGKDDDD
jgi:hypothetical protein